LPDNPEVEVKLLQRDELHYLLARSKPRRHKERAIRRRQRRGLAQALKKLHTRVTQGRLKKRDKIVEAIGRLKGRYPKGCPFVSIQVGVKPVSLTYTWNVAKFREALARDGAYLLRSNQAGWSAQEFWETYIQLTVVERAFRVLKSQLLLRPIWHHYSGRTQAHVFVCVLAYALWKTLDHLAKRVGLQTPRQTHQASSKFLAPARISARNTGSRAAAMRFLAMLCLAGCCLSKDSAIFRNMANAIALCRS
jgi:transposase